MVADVSTNGTEGEISLYTSAGDSSAKGVGVGVSVGTGVGVAVGTGVGVSVGPGVGVAVGARVSVGLGVGAVRDVASTEGAEVSGGVDWLHVVNAIAAKVHTTNRPKRKVDPFGLAFTVMSTLLPSNTRRFNGSGRHQ